MKIIFAFVIFLLLILFAGVNLGKWIDVTEKPVKSDIIVCLGGGTIDRVKKSIALMEEGYANKQVFLLLGESWYNQPYLKKHYPDMSIVIDETPKNTKEEVLFIKKYMKEHGYRSALIMTDPPHSGRVKLLTSLLSIEGDDGMVLCIVGSEVKWWNAEKYYASKNGRSSVLHEVPRIIYSMMLYNW